MYNPHNIVSFSGGKDSTAMLLLMLERGENIADVVFFDTGWEFPEMYHHLEQVEQFMGRKITRLRPRLPVGVVTEKSPFDWFFSEYPVRKRGTGEVHMIGRGWPHPQRRWCTGRKQESLKSHIISLTHRQGLSLPLQQCIGFAADEDERVMGITKQSSTYIRQRFPLIDWGVTGAEALLYCTYRGFTWGGLYERFRRVSCFCCPMQSADDLRALYRHYPRLWEKMRTMESWLPLHDNGRRFNRTSISALTERFVAECDVCGGCKR